MVIFSGVSSLVAAAMFILLLLLMKVMIVIGIAFRVADVDCRIANLVNGTAI